MPSEMIPNDMKSIHNDCIQLSDASPSDVISTPDMTTGRAP